MTKVSMGALDTKEKLVVNHKRSTILALALAIPLALVILTSPISVATVAGLVPEAVPGPANCPAPPALPDGAAAVPNFPGTCPSPPRPRPAPPPPSPSPSLPVGPGCPNCWG
jgi:hypothetical protein